METVPDLGQYVYSTTVRRGDEFSPVGGAVIANDLADPETGAIQVKVVEVWRGTPLYHRLDVDDLEPGQSGMGIRQHVLRDLLLALGRDEDRHRDPFRHLDAKAALCGAIAMHHAAALARKHTA